MGAVTELHGGAAVFIEADGVGALGRAGCGEARRFLPEQAVDADFEGARRAARCRGGDIGQRALPQVEALQAAAAVAAAQGLGLDAHLFAVAGAGRGEVGVDADGGGQVGIR